MDTYMMWECEHKIVSRLMSICMCNALVKGAKHTGARAGRETLLQSDLLMDTYMMWECEHKIVSRLMSICMCNALVKAGRETLLQ